jgi:hypothetical protein
VATSGVTSLALTTTEIIVRAFRRLGIAQDGEALTPAMYEDGREELNLLINEWNANPHLWINEDGSLSLVASQAAYVVSPRALRVTDCRYRLNGIDTPMRMFSRQEYFDQPNKTVSPSIPVNFYFDPEVEDGTLYLWPAPSATAVANYTIRYTYIRFIAIMVNANDTVDFPQQWLQPIIWNLADNLQTQYPVNDPNLANRVTAKAVATLASLSQWDNEPASLYMSPDYNADYR